MIGQINYYETLGVDRQASVNDIKKAYREKAKLFHPDINKMDGSEELFGIIQEAYETLSNTEKRAEYDRILQNLKFNTNSDRNNNQNTYTYSNSPTQDDYYTNTPTKPSFSLLKIIRGIVWFFLLIVSPISIYINTQSFEEIVFYLAGVMIFVIFKKLVVGLLMMGGIVFLLFGFFTKDMAGIIGAIVFMVMAVVLFLVFCGDEMENQ